MANQDARRARLRVLIIFVLAVTVVSLVVWTRARRAGDPTPAIRPMQTETPSASASRADSPIDSPGPGSTADPFPPDLKADAGPAPASTQAPLSVELPPNFVGTLKLIIPVAGVKPEQLRDTFTDSRSEGRAHDAIDIMAPEGTPVLAATDGEIVRLFQSDRGGTTIYQLSPDKKLLFYYAHLQSYAAGVAVGKFARQGEVIAYVGDTGNSGTGNYHLHFSVAILADPKRYWEGHNINPYPLLRR